VRAEWCARSAVAAAAVGLLLLLVANPAAGQSDDARELVKQTIAALPRVSFVAKLKLTVPHGGTRELDLRHKFVGGARASYLEVSAPPDLEGMRFLFLEHPEGRPQQFMKIAGTRKIIQVSPDLRKHAFLGSDFYVADLIAPELDAFTYSFVGETDVNGRHCKLIESIPKDPATALYAKTLIAIDPIDLLVMKRLFMTGEGKLVKVWRVEKVTKIDGYWTLQDQRMKTVPEDSESTLEITDIKYNVDLPDSLFTPKYLGR
jgi:hypothetical protein